MFFQNQTNDLTMTTAAAAAPPKKKKTKRRRISKHVAEAARKKAVIGGGENEKVAAKTTEQPHVDATATTPAKTEAARENERSSTQAIAYLKVYIESKKDKTSDSNDKTGAWKFNKNTQTWLIKHMYDAEIVSKATFSLLLEYFHGLEGKTKSRVLQQASERVIEYKEHEKKLQEKQGDNSDRQAEENDEEKTRRKEYKRARQIVQLLQG
ncbi:hypothetical protein MPSEU_000138900 [Mayamaea pseudoterrestris]|nr:hypothetical protein MPSEU_000138900 [Mayamaea pseudoterrestris]